MKKVSPFLLLLSISVFLIHNTTFSQVGEWVWIHGSNTYNNPGNFGIQGVSSPSNEPPSLYETCEWTDLNGNFWFYGGLDNITGINIHNDLWRYSPATNEWTWMTGTNSYSDKGNFGIQGVPSPANRPPSIGYGAASWVDLQGNLWMFGGVDSNTTLASQSNMWKYDISTNVWTWVNGPGNGYFPGVYGTQGVPDPANYPGGRSEVPTAWTDNAGDLWLFAGYVGGLYNDMWRYNIATNSWTWMKGSNVTNQKGWWGIMGIEDPANVPGGRRTYSHWKDNAGNLWMFAGTGQDITGNASWYLDDLWRYNISTNNWTWMNGPSVGSATNVGSYGTKCVTSSNNQPPPRFEDRASWTDANGNFWVFGGFYRTTPFSSSGLNDLWMYCVSTNKWTWEGGDSLPNSPGNWGTLNVSSPLNVPSARIGAAPWTDRNGHLYLFGGVDGNFGSFYNDLWKFTIDPSCGVCTQPLPVAHFSSSDSAFCNEGGTCIDFTDLSTGNPTSWKWSFPGAVPDTSTQQNPTNICYYTPGTYSVSLVVKNANGSDSLTISPLITFGSGAATPVLTQSHDTIFSSHASAYQWFFNGSPISGATDSFYVAFLPGDYNVQITDSIGCTRLGNALTFVSVRELNNPYAVVIYPNPAANELFVIGDALTGSNTVTVFNVLSEKIMEVQEQNNHVAVNISTLSKGVYYLQVRNKNISCVLKFIKE